MTPTEEANTLRNWGRDLVNVASRAITYSDQDPTCTESVLPKVKCNQGHTHYKLCDAPATQFELETGDEGGQSWVARCEKHAINQTWCRSVPLEPPC